MIVSQDEVSAAITHPNVIYAVDLAHRAWCEQLSREDAEKGRRYLAALPGDYPGEALRVRVASVVAVMKDTGCEPDELSRVVRKTIVTPSEISRLMHDQLLLHFMTLASDAWDDEASRHDPYYQRVPFSMKYRGQGKKLNSASQIAVLKCIPTISLKGSAIKRKPVFSRS